MKYWAPITAVVAMIALAAVAFAQLDEVRSKTMQNESRFQRIEWFLIRIGEKLGVRFEL